MAVTIPYYETFETTRDRYKPDASGFTRVLMCDWADHYQLMQQLLGYSDVNGNLLMRKLPATHPRINWAYATSVEVEPVGDAITAAGGKNPRTAAVVVDPYDDPDAIDQDNTSEEYCDAKFARLTVQYEGLIYDVLTNTQVKNVTNGVTTHQEWRRNIIKIDDPTTQYVTAFRGSFGWDTLTINGGPAVVGNGQEPLPISNAVGFTLHKSVITWTWLDVPGTAYSYSKMLGMRGSLNNAVFDGYAAETLLLDGVKRRPKISIRGDRQWEITLRFLHQSYSHNYFINSLGGIQRIRRLNAPAVNGVFPGVFPLTDFRELFKV